MILHADSALAKELEGRLLQLGYSSVIHVASERLAVSAARQRAPDLVLVGDMIDEQPGISAALRLRQKRNVPVVLIPPLGATARQRGEKLKEIAAAVEEATGDANSAVDA